MPTTLQPVLPDPCKPLANPWHGSIAGRFQSHAPQLECIATITESWTYAEVEDFSNRLGSYFNTRLAGKRKILAIYAERNAALVLSLLSIVKAGAAFVILDPRYPAKRNLQCLRIARPAGIINLTGGPILPPEFEAGLDSLEMSFKISLPATKAELAALPWLSAAALPFQPEPVSPDDCLYIAFTSGTTGGPKAVVGTHAPVVHFLQWQATTFNIDQTHRVSLLSGLAHDPLLRDIFLPLWVGGCVCVPDSGCYDLPGRLYEWMSESRINLAHLTPSLGHFLLASTKTARGRELRDLQYAFFGGEPLHYGLVRKLEMTAPQVRVVNCYGTTETPQVMGFHVVDRGSRAAKGDPAGDGGLVPVGKGIADCQLLVLSGERQLCAIGETGEICVRTPFLAQSLIDSDGNPVRQFVPNPFSNIENDRIYRTGDCGRYSEDGTVILTGRKDRQIKLRGFRVELAEIERALGDQKEILQFALDVRQLNDGNTVLDLFVVPDKDSTVDAENLRARLASLLPYYMVPSRILLVAKMPLTPNGKIDMRELRNSLDAKPPTGPSRGADAVKIRLQRVFNRVQASDGIKSNADLLISELNSLQAVDLCCAIDEEFNLKIGISEVFKCGSVTGLEQLLQQLVSDEGRPLPQGKGVHPSDSQSIDGSPRNIHPNPSVPADLDKFFEDYGRARVGTESPRKGIRPPHERFLVGLRNRIFQLLARVAPDDWRCRLHRKRGVRMGVNVSVGYDTIIETAYPWLVRIGNHCNIGMRVTIIGHFRGMGNVSTDSCSVDIQDYAFVGPGAIILPNVTIGRGAVVAAGSVVNTSVEPLTLVRGNPARVIARCGVPLSGRTSYQEFVANLIPV